MNKACMYKGIWHNKDDWDENGRSKIFNTKPFGTKTQAKETMKAELKVNNPKGYNKHKKNPKPVKVLTVKEQIDAMPLNQKLELSHELYRAALRFRRLAQSCMARSNYIDKCQDSTKIDDLSNEDLIKMSKLFD